MEYCGIAVSYDEAGEAGNGDGLSMELHVRDIEDVEGEEWRLRGDGIRQEDELGTVLDGEVMEVPGAGVE